MKTDVLVIGGGGAGERAAYEAHQMGAKVAMVVKGGAIKDIIWLANSFERVNIYWQRI